jgi:hypothetical protein
VRLLLALVMPVLFSSILACADESRFSVADVAKDLKAFYEISDKKPPPYALVERWDAAVKQLGAADANQRETAATWLRALLAQALKDEKSGLDLWRATPFFGESAQNEAREVRKWVAIRMAKAEPLAGALPVVRWYFQEETQPAFQENAATALNKVKGKEAAALRADLAGAPHANGVVVALALEGLGSDESRLPADKLRALCHHHRSKIRDAARKLYQQQVGGDCGAFDPARAMQSAPLKKLMKDLEILLTDLPAEAREGFKLIGKAPEDTSRDDLVRQGTLYDVVRARELYAAGKDEMAAGILFPQLERFFRDQDLARFVRQDIGRIYGYLMLTAFVGDRDYERAEKIANKLVKSYSETMFHHDAVRLAAQLPRRRDDFVKLKLPTATEWQQLKQKLSRSEQIDFLCRRLRLLNCFQSSQPGVCRWSDKQFAEPCRIAPNASWGLDQGKTEVINPYTELLGLSHDGSTGLKLTAKDVPQLAGYLRDDWYVLGISFWRDFHPGRNLGDTRSILQEIINDLAGKEICKVKSWTKLTPAEINAEIERLKR